MKKIYIISDTHFNHQEVMLQCGRPNNYEELLQREMKTVREKDMLIHLGDICIGKDAEMHEKYIIPLRCKKILVKGNHDHKSNSWYYNHGWDFVCNFFSDRIYGKDIVFSHEPIKEHGYDLNIHGHLHKLLHRTYDNIIPTKHILVSCELQKYKIQNIKKLISQKNIIT